MGFFFSAKPHEWHEHYVFARPVMTVDGYKIRFETAMRRLVDGEWQYRRMTDSEFADFSAW